MVPAGLCWYFRWKMKESWKILKIFVHEYTLSAIVCHTNWLHDGSHLSARNNSRIWFSHHFLLPRNIHTLKFMLQLLAGSVCKCVCVSVCICTCRKQSDLRNILVVSTKWWENQIKMLNYKFYVAQNCHFSHSLRSRFWSIWGEANKTEHRWKKKRTKNKKENNSLYYMKQCLDELFSRLLALSINYILNSEYLNNGMELE